MNYQKLVAVFFASLSVCVVNPVKAQSHYNLPLDIEGYCRAKHGQNSFAHLAGNQDAYSWRCSVVEQSGFAVGAGVISAEYGRQTSRVDRPVQTNDVCKWQYGPDYVAYLINETSGGWKCKNVKVQGPVAPGHY